jgi:hypothetical protein
MICPGCGNELLVSSYCEKCGMRRLRADRRWKARDCVVCGAGFTTPRKDSKYCSNACRQKYYRRRVTDKRGLRKNPRVSVTR